MKTAFLTLLLSLSLLSHAQISDGFSDGNFVVNPAWSGTSTDFVVNAANELQISNTVAATSYLSTPHGMSTLDDKEWRLWVAQSFSPSASNFGRIYLTSSSADLTTNPDGFFIQLGEAGSTDAVRLRKSAGGIVTEVCAGTAGQIANSFAIGLRVVRSSAGLWSLYIDPSGGTDYTLAATGTDATGLIGTHFGVLGTYTVSNANKFFYDDIYVGDEIIDTEPPALTSVTAVSASQIDVIFSETVSDAAVTTPGNYVLNPAIVVSGAAIDGGNGAIVHLTLGGNLSNSQQYQLTVGSAADLSGNTATDLTSDFTYLVSDMPAEGDLIITEFMCDPTPSIGLAEVEFVEIYNVSDKYFDLTGWKLGDASADGTVTSGWIAPGEYRILCASSSLPFYPSALAVTSFPSLNNASDDVRLKDPSLVVIDAVSYTDEWYNDEGKQDGGYTLELINPYDPCSDRSNWTGSSHFIGGTPGAQNSVYNDTPDTQAPSLISAVAFAPDTLVLLFSEGMDVTTLTTAGWSATPALTVADFDTGGEAARELTITFNEEIVASQMYTFTIGPVSDCWLNAATLFGEFALADVPLPGDLVINEILFDPGTGGTDFVELYNCSEKVLDLNGYQVANFDDNAIANSKTIEGNFFLMPGEHAVLTADSSFQLAQFPAAVPGRFVQMQLPALGNDSATVYLLYSDGTVLDRVAYKETWHLSVLDDTENKTIERIDPVGASSSASNWHTAAETIGFGTPGGRNSQYQPGGVNGDFGTLQPLFSPDNDGFEDVLQFYYKMPQPGMIATLRIFDDQGRLIREVLKSELLGLQGNVSWDGISDGATKAGLGVYIAVVEAFSIDGDAHFSKRVAFTLAGKLD